MKLIDGSDRELSHFRAEGSGTSIKLPLSWRLSFPPLAFFSSLGKSSSMGLALGMIWSVG